MAPTIRFPGLPWWDPGHVSVCFWVEVEQTSMLCRITRDALILIGDIREDLTQEQALQVYLDHRTEIEQVATELVEVGRVNGDGELWITEHEVV